MTDLDRIPLTVTWISVEHSLPPLGEFVFVAYESGDCGSWRIPFSDGVRMLPEGATHWMAWPVHPLNVVLEDAR